MQKQQKQTLIVQFNTHLNNPTLNKLKNLLIVNLITVRQSALDIPNRINIFGSIEVERSNPLNSLMSRHCPHLFSNKQNKQNLICSVIYQQNNQQLIQQIPQVRTILIRQCLPELINFHYEIQTTHNEMETLKHLGDLILTLNTIDDDKNISFFDQKQSVFETSRDSRDPKDVWKNMIYQIHGMEIDKVEPIASKFPNLQSLYLDLGGLRTIQEIVTISNTDKPKKIKKNTIKKIEQVFLSLQPNEQLQ